MQLSVVFPAYNEAKRLPPTLRRFADALADVDHELLIVDDGSTDGTVAAVQGLGMATVRCIRLPANRGKGAAVREGMLAAHGAVRVLCDADGSTGPDDLPALLDAVRESPVAIGSRYLDGSVIAVPQHPHRRVWSRLANLVVQALLLPGIVDPQCGFKAFRAEVVPALFGDARTEGWSSDLEILCRARSLGLGVTEVPVHWSDDADSRGSAGQVAGMMVETFRIWRTYGRTANSSLRHGGDLPSAR